MRRGLPLVSVVTPTYNRKQSLLRMLAALAQQSFQHECLEVLVVDDGSSDGTVDQVKRLELPFALHTFEQTHQGPAQARNLGVKQASGRLILFLDDDVVPCPDLVQLHVARHGDCHDIVVVGPMSPPGNWTRSIWVRWEEEKLEAQYQAMRAGAYQCTPRQFYTGNASLERELFLKAGGFDSAFTRAEDVELGYRLRDQGARFVFEPHAEVLHFASRTFARWRETPYQYGRYDVVMDRRKGRENLRAVRRESGRRHPLNRMLARACVDHAPLLSAAMTTLRLAVYATGRIGPRRLAFSALSAMFNLLYWQGVADETRASADSPCSHSASTQCAPDAPFSKN